MIDLDDSHDGPFMAKSFSTTISPWMATAEALAPFRLAQPLRPQGDPAPLPYLLGSGAISGETPGSCGSLLELTRGGAEPIQLGSGQTRKFLEDGDQVIFRGHRRREGFASIGFGACRAAIPPASAI